MPNINNDINLDTLGEVTSLINSTLELPTLLEIIMDTAKNMLESEAASLLLLDEDKESLIFYAVSGSKKELIKQLSVPIGKGIAGHVAQTGDALIVNDAENDPRIYKEVDQKTNQTTRQLICVPMKVKDKLIGVLEAINPLKSSIFSDEHLDVLNFIADQAAIAINNSDLYTELAQTRSTLQNRVNELSILYEFSEVINFAISIDELFKNSLNYMVKTFEIEKSFLYFCHTVNQNLFLTYSYGENLSIPNSISQINVIQIIQDNKKPFLFNQTTESNENIVNQFGLNLPSLMIPLYDDENLYGLMVFEGNQDNEVFTDYHLQLAENLVSRLNQSFSNLKMHNNLLEQDQINQELKVARLIQEKILPFTFLTPDNVEVQGLSIPAEEVGGDFYDFIPIDDKKFALVIADVSGKGIPASLFMALARNAIRTEAQQDPSPIKVISKVNSLLVKDSESGMFVTAAFFLVDTFNRAITYVSAGHDNQLLYHGKTSEVAIMKGFGKPLGILEETKFEERIVFYEPGDILILFTDGIVEAERINGDQYQEERLIQFIKNNYHLNTLNLITGIKEDVISYIQGNPFSDDFTLLVASL